MDLTPRLESLGTNRINLELEVLISSDLRLRLLMASANRVGLIVSAMRLKQRRLLVGAVTSEADALRERLRKVKNQPNRAPQPPNIANSS